MCRKRNPRKMTKVCCRAPRSVAMKHGESEDPTQIHKPHADAHDVLKAKVFVTLVDNFQVIYGLSEQVDWTDGHWRKCVTRVLRPTRVRAQLQASMSVSCASFIAHVAALPFFLSSSLKAPSCVRGANSLSCLAGAISLSIEAVGDCLIFLLIGLTLQPARVASYPVAVTRYVKTHYDQSPVSGVVGRKSAASPAPVKVSGQKLFIEGSAFFFDFVEDFAIGVGTTVTLCSLSREIIGAQSRADHCQRVLGSVVSV